MKHITLVQQNDLHAHMAPHHRRGRSADNSAAAHDAPLHTFGAQLVVSACVLGVNRHDEE